MDAKMEYLLRKANLCQYIGKFQDQCIDFEALQELSVQDLLPIFDNKLGLVGKFRSHLKKFLDEEFSDVTLQNEYSNGGIQFEELHLDSSESTINLDGDSFIVYKEDPLRLPEQLESSVNLAIETPVNSSFNEELAAHPILLTAGQSSQKRPCSVESLGPSAKRIAAEDNIVEEYLKRNCVGRGALELGKKNKILDQATRGKIVHEIIVGDVGENGDKVISTSRFEKLAEEIVKLFPKEIKATYFIPRKPAQGSQSAVQPKGLLYDKYHNLLKFLRKTGLRKSIRGNHDGEEDLDDHSLIGNDLKNALAFLEKSSSTSQEVTTKCWEISQEYRMNLTRRGKSKQSRTDLEVYFDKYNCLSLPWGRELLLKDFDFLYKDLYQPLIENWPSIYTKLVFLAQKSDEHIATDEIVKCLKLIPGFFKQPPMVGPKPKSALGIKGKQVVWKPNAKESSQGFLLYVKDQRQLDDHIEHLKVLCGKVKKGVQPFPAVIGDSERNIKFSYVVVNDFQYCVESPLVAVDTCFKICHSLHTLYPCQASYSWLFLQQAVYGFTTDWDFSAPAVSTMVEAYKNLDS